VLTVLFGIWLVLAAHLAHPQSATLEQAAYDTLVREALAAARRGDRIGLEHAAAQLISVRSVSLPGGGTSSVDNAWLQAELDRTPPDLARIAERLGALADALARPAGSAPNDALARLSALLAQPPYARPPESQAWRWLTDFLDWLVRVVEVILRPLGRATGMGDTIALLFGLLGLLLLLGVVVYLVRGLRRSVVAEARASEYDPEANLTARQALDQAAGLARSGDYRTAVRYLYIAALLRLDERRLLRYDRALTNREYLERVRDQPELRAALAPIVDVFDRVWYGHDELDSDAFEEYRAQVEQLGR
jgi:hypothetical protein